MEHAPPGKQNPILLAEVRRRLMTTQVQIISLLRPWCLLAALLVSNAPAGSPLDDAQLAWMARVHAERPAVEIIYSYDARFLPAGRKFIEVLEEGKPPSALRLLPLLEGCKVRLKVVTDGFRFSAEVLPDSNGKVVLPNKGRGSPFAYFDGKLYAVSSGNGGISVTDVRPPLYFPLPFEAFEHLPTDSSIGIPDQWPQYAPQDYEAWFRKAAMNGVVSREEREGLQVIKGSVGAYFAIVEGSPLMPSRVIAGTADGDVRDQFCEQKFSDYETVAGWMLPRHCLMTVKMNMPGSIYAMTTPETEKYRVQLAKMKASGLFDADVVDLYQHEVTIESARKVDAPNFRLPLVPGTKVYDRVNGVDFIWGSNLGELEKKLGNEE